MSLLKKSSAIGLALFLILAGCQKNDSEPAPESAAAGHKSASQKTEAPEPALPAPPESVKPLLAEPMRPAVVESPSEAISSWSPFRAFRPTLVLLSDFPFLFPLPETLHNEITEMVADAPLAELAQRGTSLVADPLFFPSMAVRAAIDAGFFSRVIWIFPSRSDKEQLSLEAFRSQLVESGNASEEEADTFSLENGILRGEIDGIPFLAAHPEALPALEEPILLHIDLSYFKPLYKGEIKTPLYPLLLETAKGLQATNWQTLGTSISLSNLEGGIPLASRFVGRDLAQFFESPSIIQEGPLPEWQDRANALYLENFMRKEEIRDTYRKIEAVEPKNASIKFALYQVALEFKETDTARDYLKQAVALDRIYALEYLHLADMALEKQRPEKAIEMLRLARTAMPENPFILLSLAKTAINAGQPGLAAEFIPALQAIPWSPVYYPNIGDEIKFLTQLAGNTP